MLHDSGDSAAIVALDIERVMIALSNASHEATLDILRVSSLDVQIDLVPRIFDRRARGRSI